MSELADLITRDRRPAVTMAISVEFAGRRRIIANATVRFEPSEPPAEIQRALDDAFAQLNAAISKELKLK